MGPGRPGLGRGACPEPPGPLQERAGGLPGNALLPGQLLARMLEWALRVGRGCPGEGGGKERADGCLVLPVAPGAPWGVTRRAPAYLLILGLLVWPRDQGGGRGWGGGGHWSSLTAVCVERRGGNSAPGFHSCVLRLGGASGGTPTMLLLLLLMGSLGLDQSQPWPPSSSSCHSAEIQRPGGAHRRRDPGHRPCSLPWTQTAPGASDLVTGTPIFEMVSGRYSSGPCLIRCWPARLPAP